MPAPVDRSGYDMLFGVVALQTQFVTAEQYAEAAIAVAASGGSIADELVRSGALDAGSREAIDRVVRARIAHHQARIAKQPTAPVPPPPGERADDSRWRRSRRSISQGRRDKQPAPTHCSQSGVRPCRRNGR